MSKQTLKKLPRNLRGAAKINVGKYFIFTDDLTAAKSVANSLVVKGGKNLSGVHQHQPGKPGLPWCLYAEFNNANIWEDGKA